MKNNNTNIVVCGVGGQGIILASNVLCYAAFLEGFDVKKSEVHGMAQRGGSVITHIRFGKKIYSPLIERGEADFILAFEKLEALRYADYLNKNGTLIVNNREIAPLPVLVGVDDYPVDIDKRLKRHRKTYFVDAERVARELGNFRIVNIVLLGFLSRFLNFNESSWHQGIEKYVKKKFIDLNIKAFTRARVLLH